MDGNGAWNSEAFYKHVNDEISHLKIPYKALIRENISYKKIENQISNF